MKSRARAITTISSATGDVLLKGPTEAKHNHPPNQEKSAAEVSVETLKRKATAYPEQKPAQLLRTESTGIAGQINL